MILRTALGAGVAAVRGTARVVASAASHAFWWVDYRVGGRPRQAPEDPRRPSRDER